MRRNKVIYGLLGVLVLLFAGLGILLHNANAIIAYELRQYLGNGFSVEDIALRWGSVKASGIAYQRPDDRRGFSVRELGVRANLLGLLRKENVISDVTLDTPYLLVEIDRNGEMILPVPRREQASGRKQKKQETGSASPAPFLIRKIKVADGSLDYLDRKISAVPAMIKLRDIRADVKNISAPPDSRLSNYEINASVPGREKAGRVSAIGATNFRTKDTKARLSIRDLDITQLRPYFEKKGDVEVTRGLLSLDADIAIQKRRIHAAGNMIIKGLDFRSGGSRFLGLPLVGVTKLLKDGDGRISLDFTIEGDLDNPKFSITESLVQKLSLSLAKSLGMPIGEIGKSVFDLGGSALKRLFK